MATKNGVDRKENTYIYWLDRQAKKETTEKTLNNNN